MSQTYLKATGLYTFTNDLSAVPEGSAEVADNLIVDADGVYEPRRGFGAFLNPFDGSAKSKQHLKYKDIIFRHYANTLQYEKIPVQATGYFQVLDSASITPGSTISVDGIIFTSVSGAANVSQFTIGASDNDTAQNIAFAFTNHPILSTRITAVPSGEFVNLVALSASTVGNGYALITSQPSAINVSDVSLTGGINAEFLSFDTLFTEPETGTRIKGKEVNGNFYITSSKGIRKIAVAENTQIDADSVKFAGIERATVLEGKALTLKNFQSFLPSAINTTSDTISISDHSFVDSSSLYFVPSGISESTLQASIQRMPRTATTSAVSISVASPAVVSWTAHGLADNTIVQFTSTGTLPTGLSPNVSYFVSVVNANSFHVATQPNGAGLVNTTVVGSGVHTAHEHLSPYNSYFVKKISNSEFELYHDSDLTMKIDFVTAGTGNFEFRLSSVQNGFLPPNSAVSYRYLFGEKDANGNLLLGFPSQPEVVTYSGTSSLQGDFNGLLKYLDSAAAQDSTQLLNDTDYFSSLSLGSDASGQDLYDNVEALAIKLDKDLTTFTGTPALTTYRTVTSVNTGTDTITLTAHGFRQNDPITVTWTTAYSGLVQYTQYYVVYVNANDFKLSLSVDGTAVDIISAGTGLQVRLFNPYALTSIPTVGAPKAARFYNGNLQLITAFSDGVSSFTGDYPAGFANPGQLVYVSGLTGTLESGNGQKLLVGCATPYTFTSSSWDATANTISLPSTNFVTGMLVRFLNTGSLTGTGLSQGVDYVIINPTIDTFQLATVASPAAPIDLTGTPTGIITMMPASILIEGGSDTDSPAFTSGLSNVFIGKEYTGIEVATNRPTEPELLGAEYAAIRDWMDAIVLKLEGEPSRIVAIPAPYNAFRLASTGANVEITAYLPDNLDITTQFVRVYRSSIFTASDTQAFFDLVTDDELRLDYETNMTQTDINNGYIRYLDIASDSFVSTNAFLYTNALSGEGIGQANAKPPVALDLTLFKNSMFYGNTSRSYSAVLNVVGVARMKDGDTLSLFNNTSSDSDNIFTFREAGNGETSFTASSVTLTNGDNIVFTSANNQNKIVVWFGTTQPTVSGATAYVNATSLLAQTETQRALSIKTALANFADIFSVVYDTDDASLIVLNTAIGANTLTVQTGTVVDSLVSTSGSAASTNPALNEVNLYKSNGLSPSQQIELTSKSLVAAISKSAATNALYYAYYLSNNDSAPGIIQIEERVLNGAGKFRMQFSATGISSFSPDINSDVAIPSSSVVYNGTGLATVTKTSHGLVTGNLIAVSGNTSINSVKVVTSITRISANVFTIDVPVAAAGGFSYSLASAAEASANEAFKNRLYYAKERQPDSVPLLNYLEIGPQDKAIKRVIALRESLFILKEEGIYRLSGTYGNYVVSLHDSSCLITSADSADVLNNKIYALTTQGVTTIDDGGTSIISRPIENKVLTIAQLPAFKAATFGFGYESARSYHLWTVASPTDTVATQCLRYNTFTDTWTSWSVTATSGLVNSTDDTIILGSGDDNYTVKERKSFDRVDYTDRELEAVISEQDLMGGKAVLISNIDTIDVGDVIIQMQYLTEERWISFLSKLDEDAGINVQAPGTKSPTYFSSMFAADGGADIGAKLNAVITVLNTLEGYATPVPTSLVTLSSEIRDRYNTLMIAINTDTNSQSIFRDYSVLTINSVVEYPVTAVNAVDNKITLSYSPSFFAGPVVIAKSIKTEVLYNPHHFGNPSLFKQVNEGTFMFKYFNFTQAVAGFSTDLSPSIEEIPFNGLGNGAFGLNIFGDSFFGGNLAPIPFRTYIPRNKQRSRFLRVYFRHNTAREHYQLYGISLNPVPGTDSTRGYR